VEKFPLIEKLSYWVREREKVRIRKEAGEPKPWSPDWVFQQIYFCNVHREDDRVTRWLREHWNNPFHPKYEVAICLARMVNWPDTLQIIQPPWNFPDDYNYLAYVFVTMTNR